MEMDVCTPQSRYTWGAEGWHSFGHTPIPVPDYNRNSILGLSKNPYLKLLTRASTRCSNELRQLRDCSKADVNYTCINKKKMQKRIECSHCQHNRRLGGRGGGGSEGGGSAQAGRGGDPPHLLPTEAQAQH